MNTRTKNTGSESNLSFEDAYQRLEETVHALEEGGLALAEATRLFEGHAPGPHLQRDPQLRRAEDNPAANGIRGADAPPHRGKGRRC
ncbi:MAG: Exonuclease small subunit [Dehalococcoidia bacterium]|nr:Exonuclease small subunit [Dehalococcoidia bacterium]